MVGEPGCSTGDGSLQLAVPLSLEAGQELYQKVGAGRHACRAVATPPQGRCHGARKAVGLDNPDLSYPWLTCRPTPLLWASCWWLLLELCSTCR